MSTDPMTPVRLVNGSVEALNLVNVVLMSLKRLFEEMEGSDPAKAMGAMLALYDLKMLCLGDDQLPGQASGARGIRGRAALLLDFIERELLRDASRVAAG